MPIDNWLILALIMIFISIIFCAILPMIIRLSIARRRYHLELHDIVYSHSNVYLNIHEHYSPIPFIDDLNKEDDTFI